MARGVEAIITPSVLLWARRSAGFEVPEAAKKVPVSPDKLVRWEAGSDRPTIKQLRKLARAYRRPLALFYLPDPPTEFQPMHDFRRLPGQVAGIESPGLRLELRKAIARRDVALELRRELGWPLQPFSFSASLFEQPEGVGPRIRSLLQFELADQVQWQHGYETFNQLRSRIEHLDVLVCQMTGVETVETRGFSIAEEILPVICLNIKDPPQARCFSLLHEFTHLLLRQGGVCDFDEYTARPAEDLAVERFCNHTAATALVPSEALLEDPLITRLRVGSGMLNEDIAAVANKFGVSREALVRRLLTLGRVTEEFYRAKRAQFNEEYLQAQANRPAGFAPPDRLALSAAGPSFTRTVLESYYRERITASDLADFLDVRLKHVAAIEAALATLGGSD